MSFDHVPCSRWKIGRASKSCLANRKLASTSKKKDMIVSDDLLVAQQLLCRTGDVALRCPEASSLAQYQPR